MAGLKALKKEKQLGAQLDWWMVLWLVIHLALMMEHWLGEH